MSSKDASPFKKWMLKNDVDGWNTIPDKRFEIIFTVTLFRPTLQSASLQSVGINLRRCPTCSTREPYRPKEVLYSRNVFHVFDKSSKEVQKLSV